MTSIASLSTATRLLAHQPSTHNTAPAVLAPVAAPRPASLEPVNMQAQAAAVVAQLETRAASGSGASIVLQKAGAAYELTGTKTVAVGTGVTSATQTVDLRAGAAYAVTGAFGLSSTRGNMKLELLDPKGKVVQSVLGGVGKTSAKLALTAAASGTYTLRLTGQPIDKTATTAIYQSYSLSVAQAASRIPKSGDANIDALVFGGTNSWLHDAGALASVSKTPVKAGVTALNGALTQTVKYAFATADSLKSLSGADARGAAVMTDVQKIAVADGFAYLSNVINLRFEAVSDPAQADIVFGQNNQSGVSAGYANAPNQSGGHAEYLFLASDQSTNSSFTNGSYGLTTLLHEIGHTLGLKHPGNYNAGGGGAPGPFLPTATDNRRFSLMSYHAAPGTNANPQTLMSYDVLALQFLYGANTDPASPAALAKHQTTTFTDSWSGLETLWAPKGAELDASQTTRKNIFDFREGAFSSMAMTGGSAISAGSAASNNVGLAYGSKITRATGGSAADAFYAAATGDVTTDGGTGTDTLCLAGKASEWSKSGDIYTRKVAGKEVAHVAARNIETIAYYDSAKAALIHA